MEAIKTSVTNSPVESGVKGKAVKKSGKRIGYNYIILKSLKESQKNDVVKCLYIKSLTNFGICVIKEGSYGDSKDKQGRDIKDRLMWQKELHEQLQGKVRLPRLLGSFEENGNYYLVLERIHGKSLYKACKEAGKELREGLITGNKLGMKFLDYMIQMIELLETLHKHRIVHRDVTATNFMITPAGKVAVIDMELSYSLERSFPDPPFQLGTHGYMSPEQEGLTMPAVEQDIFSVGAILLQVWTGIWPTKLTNGSFKTLTERVHFFIPNNFLAEIITQCLNADPDQRPLLSQIKHAIFLYKNLKRKKDIRYTPLTKRFTREELLDTVHQSIGAISSPLFADEEKGWFTENVKEPKNPDKKKINKIWYASFQKGAAGIVYLLCKADSMGFDVNVAMPHIEKAIDLIELRYINRINETHPSLYFGSTGIAAVLSIAIRQGLIDPQAVHFEWIKQLLEKDNEIWGLKYGIAGQGIATWHCQNFLHAEKTEERLKGYADRLLDLQKSDGSWLRSTADKNNRVTRGFAHGVAGIVYFLLEYANKSKNKEALEGAQRGLDWLMKKAVHQNGSIRWRSFSGKEIAPWWCEGAAGIALTFIKGYSILKDSKYKEHATGALYNHDKNVIDTNLSQCHGLSGLGEIYLEAFRVFQQEEWLERADWITQVLMHMKNQHSEYGPYWLVESERQPVADFMTGNSGIIHYLLRYCFKDKIGYPLL